MNVILLASAPVVIILLYVYIRDKYEKEPFGLLLKTLLAGALTTIPILLVGTWLSKFLIYFTGLQAAAYKAFIVAALNEEFFKFAALVFLIWRHKAFDEKFDGIVYAVFVSLGFAWVENIMYVLQYGQDVAYSRAITAVPMHAILGVTMGYYFSMAKFFEKRKVTNFITALLMPVLLHGIYNFILMSQHEMYLLIFLPFLFYLIWSGFKKMKALSDDYPYRFK